MRLGHFHAWAPHCPACARDGRGTPPLGLSDWCRVEGDEVPEGSLVCGEATCRAEYPIIDGMPLITAGLTTLLGERGVELLLRDDLPEAAVSALGDAMGAGSWFDSLRQGLSTYVWDAYADLDPAESHGDPAPGAARRCLESLLALAGLDAVPDMALDLGCAAGRTTFELAARGSGLVLGVDSGLAALRVARSAQHRGEVRYGRRRVGLVFDERRVPVALSGRERVDFWACDATALPFQPGRAGLVAALNLLDCVPDPAGLLRSLAAVLAPGGHLLLATPFDWATRATPMPQWIGGHSQRGPLRGAAEPLLRLLLEGRHPLGAAGLVVTGEGEADWHTRLHDRASVRYRSHMVTATVINSADALDK